ncbi:MAG: hypothetical protein Q4A60_09670 [Pasteurellaceae bacterium]|nr:hypothetical protein [Pasteurellaceae bacterium]
MFGLFGNKVDKLIKQIENARASANYFDNPVIYARLELALSQSNKWTNNKKSRLIEAVIQVFEGMDGWNFISAESSQTIFEITQSEMTLKCLKLIAESIDDVPEIKRLNRILKEVERIQHRQKNPIYDLSQRPSITFKDEGLKLAIIHQLMFIENKLHPKFDIQLFSEEYTKYCIDLDLCGASSEAMEYLLNLEIPQTLLDQIEILYVDSNADLYKRICFEHTFMVSRYREGGYVPLTDRAISDLKLLPNLKEIHLLSEDRFIVMSKIMDETPFKMYDLESIMNYKDKGKISIDFINALKGRDIRVIQNGKEQNLFFESKG